MKLTVQEAKDFKVLPPDSILHLRVEERKEEEFPTRDRKSTWWKLSLRFKILGIQAVGDGSDPSDYQSLVGESIWGSCSMNITESPENRLKLWAEAILGVQFGLGQELDTAMFDGRQCRGVTVQYDSNNTDAQGNAYKRHRVEHLLPPAQAQNGYAQPQVQQDPWSGQQQPPQQGWAQPGVASQQPQPQQQWNPVQPQQQPQQAFAQPGQQDPWGGSEDPPF